MSLKQTSENKGTRGLSAAILKIAGPKHGNKLNKT